MSRAESELVRLQGEVERLKGIIDEFEATRGGKWVGAVPWAARAEKAEALAVWADVDGLDSYVQVTWEGDNSFYAVKVPALGLKSPEIGVLVDVARSHDVEISIEGNCVVLR